MILDISERVLAVRAEMRSGTLGGFCRHVVSLQFAGVASGICSTAQIAVVSRFIGPAELGIFGLVNASTTVARQIFDSRSSDLVVRYYHKLDDQNQQRSLITFALMLDVGASLLGAALMAFAAGLIARIVLHNEDLAVYVQLGCWTLIASGGSSVAVAIMNCTQNFARTGTVDAIASAFTFLITVIAIHWSPGALALLVAGVIASAVQTLLRWYGALSVLRADLTMPPGHLLTMPDWAALRPVRRELLRYVGGTNVLMTLKMLQGNLPTLLIGALCTQEGAGLYFVAQRLISKMSLIINPIQQVLFAKLSKSLVGPRAIDTLNDLLHATVVTGLILAPCVVGIAVFGRFSVNLLLGTKYLAALPVVQIVLAGYSVGWLFTPIATLLMARGLLKTVNVWFFVAAIAQFGTLWTLVPRYGAVAGGIAVLVFYVLFTIGISSKVIQVLKGAAETKVQAQ